MTARFVVVDASGTDCQLVAGPFPVRADADAVAADPSAYPTLRWRHEQGGYPRMWYVADLSAPRARVHIERAHGGMHGVAPSLCGVNGMVQRCFYGTIGEATCVECLRLRRAEAADVVAAVEAQLAHLDGGPTRKDPT